MQSGVRRGPCACRVMLSDKLLSKTDYNCDREIRTLELLKLRFGDANLHNCEASLLHWTCLLALALLLVLPV